ncbi:MAG: hypothetical protein K9K66_04295 [Desulfarculaceae bacterium]|nr:hypothetical protein [Desulfarculaceae bacterium]MCF8073263.1 hypothetical protein [Desulfarculaceae bacterium]MCF8100859.1 hypothetical protein [Desulfarculaceae bacterium]
MYPGKTYPGGSCVDPAWLVHTKKQHRHECAQCHTEVWEEEASYFKGPPPDGWIENPDGDGELCGNCANSWALGRYAA